jgi:hypothetical protein
MALLEVKAPTLQSDRIAPDAIIKVDLDDRAFLFPGGKLIPQLHILAYRPHKVRFEALYAFNENKTSPELFELSAADARELSRRLVESVYRAQSCQLVSRDASLGITVVPNGYIIQFGPLENTRELMLSTGCIWRVCGGIARAVDFISPIASN